MKLTERRIEGLEVERSGKDRLVFDDAQRGLAVRVTAGGGRTYLCQYTLHGRKWRVPLGACSAVALSKAREAAAGIMGDVSKGRNPAAERKDAAATERAKRARNQLTLRVLIEDWQRVHLSGRRASYSAEAVRALHHAFQDVLDDPADDLDRTAVVRALDALARRRKRKGDGRPDRVRGAAITSRTAAYGRAAYGWALKRGVVRANPFADLPVPKSNGKRDRVLSDRELGEIWRAAGDATQPYGIIVRLLILTGQRRGEVAGMTWAELDEDLMTWTLPGSRTKNGAPRIVPLSQPARDILRALLGADLAEGRRAIQKRRAEGTLVLPGLFGTPFAGWSKSKAALDEALIREIGSAGLDPWSLHDLRRTVATGLQRLGVRLEVTEAVLNHISGSRAGIAGVYQRHDWADEKRHALEAWGAHVEALAKGEAPSSKIVTLASAR